MDKRYNDSLDLQREQVAVRILNDFDVKIPMFSWSGMSIAELIAVYNELAEENGMPAYNYDVRLMNDGDKWLAQKALLALGFTKGLIEKLLPAPRLAPNPHCSYAPDMKLWRESEVLKAMETPEFKETQIRLAKRRHGAKEVACRN